MALTRPEATLDTARALLAQHYNLQCTEISELPSYDDRNFYVVVPNNASSSRYVLKIHNAEDSENLPLLECFNAAMRVINSHNIACNLPVANLTGGETTFAELEGTAGKRLNAVRLLTYVDGMLLKAAEMAPSMSKGNEQGQ